MAVIRRTVSAVNKRIGVNNFDTGADQIGAALADAGNMIREKAFRIDAQKAEKAGADAALSVDAKKFREFDEQGNPKAIEPPEGFGRIARDQFQRVVERRFVETMDKDIRLKMQELAIKYDRDPLGFQRAADSYLTGMIDVSDNKFKQTIVDIGSAARESTQLRIMQSERNRARENAAQHILSENTTFQNTIAIEARAGNIDTAKAMVEERKIATKEGEGAGLKVGASNAVEDSMNGTIAGSYLSSEFSKLSRQDRLSINSAIATGGQNVVLSKEAKEVFDKVSNLISPSNQSAVLAQTRSTNSTITSEEDSNIRQNNIAASERLNNFLQTNDDVSFALENSYIEEANKAINTPKDFDVIFGGTIIQLTARIDEIKDLTSMVEGDGKPLNSATSANMQKEAKKAFIEPWLLNASAQGNQDQLKTYILTGTHDGSLNSYQINTIDKLKEFKLLSATDVDDPNIRSLLNTDIGKLVDQQKKQQLQVDLTNEANDLSAKLSAGFVTTDDGTSFEEEFFNKVSKTSLSPPTKDALYKIVEFGALRGEIGGMVSGLNSSQLESIISYVDSDGRTDIDDGITKMVGDKILSERNEEAINVGSKHLENIRTNVIREEQARANDIKYQNELLEIIKGQADPNSAAPRKTVDKFLIQNDIDIYKPETWQNKPEAIAIMAKVPPQKLVDALNIMTQTGNVTNPDAILSLYRTLSSYTGFGAPQDVIGDSLGGFQASEAKKAMIDEMIEGIDAGIYDNTKQAIETMIKRKKEVTQITIERAIGTGQTRTETMGQILDTSIGSKNRDQYIDREFTGLAEQLAAIGYDKETITTKLSDIFERDYGDAGVVVDFDRPIEGRKKTRMSLDKLTRQGEDVSDIHAVLNQQLKSIDAVLFDPNKSFPIGFTTRTKGFLEGQFEWFEDPRFKGKSMVVLSPAPDATKANPKFLTYQVRRRDGILILDPFIVEKDGKPLWPSFDINSEMVEARGFRELNDQAMKRSELEAEAAKAAADDEAQRIRLENADPDIVDRYSGFTTTPQGPSF
mgnify:CR=1 FL=1